MFFFKADKAGLVIVALTCFEPLKSTQVEEETAMVYMIVAIVAAVLAYIVAKSMIKSEPKRFGLKEAEAAAKYINGDPAAAKPVMGVVIGVLGFENKVDEDLQKLMNEKDADNAKRTEELRANTNEIGRLLAEIEKVRAANVELDNQMADAVALVADKAKVAELFKS